MLKHWVSVSININLLNNINYLVESYIVMFVLIRQTTKENHTMFVRNMQIATTAKIHVCIRL